MEATVVYISRLVYTQYDSSYEFIALI